MTSQTFIQVPTGAEVATSSTVTAADQPFNPGVAIALLTATALAGVILWLNGSSKRRS